MPYTYIKHYSVWQAYAITGLYSSTNFNIYRKERLDMAGGPGFFKELQNQAADALNELTRSSTNGLTGSSTTFESYGSSNGRINTSKAGKSSSSEFDFGVSTPKI